MRTRHKTPQTFSLWMVDVLCCSLGAVILLWLYYSESTRAKSHEARKKSDEVLELEKLLAESNRAKSAASKESTDRQKTIDELRKDLTTVKANSAEIRQQLEELAKLKDLLEDEAKKKEKEHKAEADKSKEKITDLVEELNKLKKISANAESLLVKRNKDLKELEELLKGLGKEKSDLEKELKTSTDQDKSKQRKIEDLTKETKELVARLAAAQKLVDDLEDAKKLLPKLKEDLKTYQDKFNDEESKRKLTQADLAKRLEEIAKAAQNYKALLNANQLLETRLEGLSEDKRKLLADLAKANRSTDDKVNDLKELLGKKDLDLKKAIDNLELLKGNADRINAELDRRFAGVSLTGESVVFLIDTSGSMDLTDENTPAPEKWPGVRDTLARIMSSMKKLKKFQVITFSEEIAHPLGRAGEWIEFDEKKSPEQVRTALARIKPSGGTNLHKAFEATFKMRQNGLDTVYLLSDGLPSDGEGLTPEQDRATLKEPSARAQLLTKHLRKKLKDDWNKSIKGAGPEQVRINAIGFFYESPDVGAFLWALSRDHDGSFVGMSKP